MNIIKAMTKLTPPLDSIEIHKLLSVGGVMCSDWKTQSKGTYGVTQETERNREGPLWKTDLVWIEIRMKRKKARAF